MSQDAPHILVTGDAWQYVPFGRARIKALRATGLNYASQTFSINGATIKVRIAGTQSFINVSGGDELYMETGQLGWTFPAPESPTRGDPAQWYFLDIPTTDKYLGKIASDGKQANSPALAEAQESIAIGYAKAKSGTPEEIAAADAKKKADYLDATVMKKMVAGFFPASLFSGKMRLFMQAQYGSAETLKPKLKLGLSGTSPTLSYVTNEIPVQFGFWPHLTTGIYRTTDGNYFLINLGLTVDGTSTVVTYYPIIPGSSGAALLNEYKTADETKKAQVEAYWFSSCSIQTEKGKTITLPVGAKGTPLAFGWKFNSDGSEARIVVHQTLNAGTSTVRWKSSTVTVKLAYASTDGVEVLSATGTTTINGEWIDGWGTWNIFVPETETQTSPLSLYSLRVGSPAKGVIFTFPAVEVYGYYIKDEWKSVTVSCAADTGASYSQTNTDLFYLSSFRTIPNNYQYSHTLASSASTYTSEELYNSTSMTVSVGGASYGGDQKNGVFLILKSAPAGGSTVDNPVDFCGSFVGEGYPIVAPGYMYSTGGGANNGGFIEGGSHTQSTHTFTGTKYNAWALVIPGGDCCAANVATRSSDGAGTYSLTVKTVPQSATRFTGTFGSFVPYRKTWQWGTWFGYRPGTIVTVNSVPAAPPVVSKIYCHNAVVNGEEGVPGSSLTGLFDVAYTYPQYDRGMYTYTSNGLRYVMSEGLKSPSSAYHDRRFVGWA